MDEGAKSTELQLCRGMMRVWGPSVGVVPGDALLEEMLPLERRRELWKKWELASEIKLPPLDHSLMVKMGWFAGGFVFALFAIAVLRTVGIQVPSSVMAGGVAGVLLGAIGLRVFGGKAVEFPAGVKTIRDLAVRMEARKA